MRRKGAPAPPRHRRDNDGSPPPTPPKSTPTRHPRRRGQDRREAQGQARGRPGQRPQAKELKGLRPSSATTSPGWRDTSVSRRPSPGANRPGRHVHSTPWGKYQGGLQRAAGTENQFIVDTTVHQRPGDTACAPSALRARQGKNRAPAHSWPTPATAARRTTPTSNATADAYVKHSEFFRSAATGSGARTRCANWEYDESPTVHLPGGLDACLLRRIAAGVGLRYTGARTARAAPRANSKSADPDSPEADSGEPDLNAFKSRASADAAHTEIGSALRKEALRRRGDRVRRHQEKPRVHEVHAQPREVTLE